MDFDQQSQPEVIRRMHEVLGDRLIVVALRDPYELGNLPAIKSYLCAFSFRPSAARAAAEILLGERPARGQSPVSVPGTEVSA
jgi:beta-N-acetylhexosaminidase